VRQVAPVGPLTPDSRSGEGRPAALSLHPRPRALHLHHRPSP